MSKYGNRKTAYGGRMFDSVLEAKVAQQLDTLRKATDHFFRVTNIEYQVRYPIAVNGVKICAYVADFVVTYADGHVEVIDAKGMLTPVYKLKKKLMLAAHGIAIKEAL